MSAGRRDSSGVDGLEIERERSRAVGGVVSADPDEGVRFFVKHVLSVCRKVDISMRIDIERTQGVGGARVRG